MPGRKSLTPLTAAQRDLAGDPAHVSLATSVAAAFAARMWVLRDEFRSAALLGLTLAARRYDPHRDGVDFWAFARRRVVGEIIDAIRYDPVHGRGRSGHDAQKRMQAEQVGDHDDFVFVSRDKPVGWEIESEDAVEAIVLALVKSPTNRERLRRRMLDASFNSRPQTTTEQTTLWRARQDIVESADGVWAILGYAERGAT